jgi:hypothetical protein
MPLRAILCTNQGEDMKTIKELKIEILKLAVAEYLSDGVDMSRRKSEALCFAVSQATGNIYFKSQLDQRPSVSAAELQICTNIKQAIGGYTYATEYLRRVWEWPYDTAKYKFQVWRKDLAEKLIKQYEGEE